MNKNEIMNNFTRTFNKVSFRIKKHSPEILVAAGVVGTVASAVMACKATTKVSAILDDTKEQLDAVHDVLEKPEVAKKYVEKTGEEYTEEMGKKDTAIIYVQTGVKLAKLYAPSIILGAASLTCIIASNNILKKRNVALAAAYATIDKGFKEYRSRVVERFGNEVDRQLRYNIKAEEVKETIVDENGEEKTVTKTVETIVPGTEASIYARYFEEYTRDDKGNVCKNTYWNDSNEYNLMFLKQMERYANDKLIAEGHLFLNDVYKMLGLPTSKAGQVVGWVYDPDNHNGDNYIDFGMYWSNQNYSDFVYGNDPILLDFNVDGNIWEMM